MTKKHHLEEKNIMDRKERKDNKLKLVSWYDDNYKSIIKKAEESNNVAYADWWYLHGKLENIFGYDKASIINAKECPQYIRKLPNTSSLGSDGNIWKGKTSEFEFIPYLYLNGIIDCEIIGVNEPCIGYFWTTNESPLEITNDSGEVFRDIYWHQRGLVCLKSDKEGCEYALKRYKEKVKFL